MLTLWGAIFLTHGFSRVTIPISFTLPHKFMKKEDLSQIAFSNWSIHTGLIFILNSEPLIRGVEIE
jgi:hypothetical protein